MGYATRNAAMKLLHPTLLATVVALIIANAGCTTEASDKAMTVSEWKAELDSKLVPGASAAEVEAHLDAKGIEHSSLIDNAELAHMGFDPATFEIKAIIRGVRRSLLVSTDISATFVFSRDKKLITTKVEEVHTGL